MHVAAQLTSAAAQWSHANISQMSQVSDMTAANHPCLDSKVLSNSIQDELDLLLSWLRLHCDLTAAICMQPAAGEEEYCSAKRINQHVARNVS